MIMQAPARSFVHARLAFTGKKMYVLTSNVYDLRIGSTVFAVLAVGELAGDCEGWLHGEIVLLESYNCLALVGVKEPLVAGISGLEGVAFY